ETARYLAQHPWELYRIPPDYFEKIIAEIMASHGFEVQLNVRLLGAGKGDEADIIAVRQISGMKKPIRYIIECKRYAKERKVDLKIATHLYGLKHRFAQEWGLDRVLLATTSNVTKDVMEEYGNRWDFEIKDHEKIIEWLEEYSESKGGVFLRKQGLYTRANELVLTSLKIGDKHKDLHQQLYVVK
ncbi:unnamed protein product, partial [marine sediment metagenome]